MPPKQKALWMLGMLEHQIKSGEKPFSNAMDAIAACDQIIQIFDEYHPPLTSDYWRLVKSNLTILM